MEKLVMANPAGAATSFGAALAPISRLLLWSLFAAYVAVYLAGAKYVWLTAGAGYAVAVLAILRTIWAFVGPRTGGLAAASRSPRRLIALARQKASPWAQFILTRVATPRATAAAFMALLAYVSCAGMLMTASPLSGSHAMLAAHDAGVYSLVALVFLHLAWAVLESAAQGERLAENAFRCAGHS